MALLLYIILSVIISDSLVASFRINIVSDIKPSSVNDNSSKKVCVIGAGVSGLTVSKYLKEEGINFTVFEATKYLGGTWRYDPRVGEDENGLPIHTSMYKSLRTNQPNPVMELSGFPFPDNITSYPSWDTYYEYLQKYAMNFEIEKHIKFLHKVLLVRREGNVWKVKHKNVETKEIFEEEYNYVIVGNGRLSKPNMPNITGENLFQGTIIHSHDYRVRDPYKGRRVLVIGAGPSGLDISIDVAKVCGRLIHSYHLRQVRTTFPSHYVRKPDVKEFNETGAIFDDGTYEDLDDVIYSTGYQLDYPFLDETSELKITSKSVTPLYQEMVNVNQPSMVIIGLFPLVLSIDAQARYATALVKGNFTLPSRAVMLKDKPKFEFTYYPSLSEESGTVGVPPVMYAIRAVSSGAFLSNLYTFRDYEYTVIHDQKFTRTLKTKSGSIQLPIETYLFSNKFQTWYKQTLFVADSTTLATATSYQL